MTSQLELPVINVHFIKNMFYLQKYQHGLTFSSNTGQSWKMQTKHRPPNHRANTLLHTFPVNDPNFITGLSESLSVEKHYESSRPLEASEMCIITTMESRRFKQHGTTGIFWQITSTIRFGVILNQITYLEMLDKSIVTYPGTLFTSKS